MSFWAYQEMPPESAADYKKPKEIEVIAYTKAKITVTPKRSTPKKAKQPKELDVNRIANQKTSDKIGSVTKQHIERIFSGGPLTVLEIVKLEPSNNKPSVYSLLSKWKSMGLVKVVGLKGKAPSQQKIWDKA